jgi:tRNA modification GTPase
LDFPDEVEEPRAPALRARLEKTRDGVAELTRGYERGRLVREGVSVALIGPPNAGKSSLLNALLGADRAMVSELAGTTRDTIEEILALDGFAARNVDTAGIRAHADRLESEGIARARSALAAARIAAIVIDASVPLSVEAEELLTSTRERERVLFFNKSDLGRVGFDARAAEESDAILGSVNDENSLAAVRAAIERIVLRGELPDLERPHLANVRQLAAAIDAERALSEACATVRAGEPPDLIVGDLLAASASLGLLTGHEASEEMLDGIFSRFCIGK